MSSTIQENQDSKLYQECYNDIMAYVKCHKNADRLEVFHYIESILVPETLKNGPIWVNIMSPKYNPIYKEIPNYKLLMNHISNVINETWSGKAPLTEKQALIEDETRKYLLKSLAEMLVFDNKTLVDFTLCELEYFIICNKNTTIPFGPEAQEVYNNLSNKPGFANLQAMTDTFLKKYQYYNTEELKQLYDTFNGKKYVTMVNNEQVQIIPEQPEPLPVTVTVNCETILPDKNFQCPKGYIYSGIYNVCVKLPDVPNAVSTFDQAETNTRTVLGQPVATDNKIFKVKVN